MTGQSNLFSSFGFRARDGKLDNNTRAFLSKFKARVGASIPDLAPEASWPQIAVTINGIIGEFVAQGWIKKGFDANEAALANSIRAVTMIPAATEWAYAPYEVLRDFISEGFEFVTTENSFSVRAPSGWTVSFANANKGRIGNPACDWHISLDNLQNQLPNVQLVNLFVAWYGDDLRCGQCTLRPGVTRTEFNELPHAWSCAGLSRAVAHEVSFVNGAAAFGGTPDDQSVVDAIKDLKARKLRVAFTPFILMDIAAGNGLTDPYTGNTGQPVYPWRGRIICDPAPGRSGSVDKTAEAASQIAVFVSQYRAFVLHYANLCAAAGGVDVFVLGTELRGLTQLRDDTGGYPFVGSLKRLAADVKAILPAAKLTYAADWSEWFGHQPADGSGDVRFNLDPLWADPNIDAVAFDNYWPLSDWRDGDAHLDFQPGRVATDYAYLIGNIRGGEGYDWFYASQADRDAQIRTPITDGAYGKPWVFRYKDIWSWWANKHYDRPGGVESLTPTDWVPQSKPIWFAELGCPSIDKGSNRPNVFFDPKSSESAVPYYSNGKSDYLIQRRYLHSMLRFFDEADPEFTEDRNPTSAVYGGRMVDLNHAMIYTWDARPYPHFPLLADIWSDGANWPFGHWIGGKLATFNLPQELDNMAIASTFAPRHPYIVDPATGKLDKQYSDFFQAIEFIQGDPIPNVPIEPTPAEVASAVNAILAVLRAQKRLSA